MKRRSTRLSAIVITLNSAKKLEAGLKSLPFADEIIVVDAGSTDATVEIAKKAGAMVIAVKPQGYSASRNIGARAAKCEWLLYIDSDERISPTLQKAIVSAISNPSYPYSPAKLTSFSSYKIYRKNIILGKWLRHGGWWPDPVHRLIKKSALTQWKGELHEYPVVAGEVGLIKEPLIHESKDSISEMVANSRQFAPIEARLKLEAGHPRVRIYHFGLACWREFWYRGVVKFGWLDGVIGIIEVGYQVFHQILVYSTLWQLQHSREHSQSR